MSTWSFVIEPGQGWHIVPNGDLREHDTGVVCWCRPVPTEDGIVVHTSMDGREAFEEGRRKPS